jgi:streptogramin lyase
MLLLGVAVGMAVAGCGSGDAEDGTTTTSAPAETTVPAGGGAETTVGDTTTPAAGGFAVDLDGGRIAPELVAGYGDLSVHQVAAGSDVWVTVGDAAGGGEAFIVRYALDGSEIARIPDDGRPLGIVADPDGRGAWFGDAFNGTLEFVDASSDSIASVIDGAVSSLGSTILSEEGSIWSMSSRTTLVRVDPAEAQVVEEFEVGFESSPGSLVLDGGILWGNDTTADTVTAVDLQTGTTQAFTVAGPAAMIPLDDGTILVSGEEALATIDPATGEVTDVGAVVYPDKSEAFPARFTALERTPSGLYGFDGVHGRLVRVDLEARTAVVIDEIPIGFVGVGDIAESEDGTLWLVVAGEEADGTPEEHLRRYEIE